MTLVERDDQAINPPPKPPIPPGRDCAVNRIAQKARHKFQRGEPSSGRTHALEYFDTRVGLTISVSTDDHEKRLVEIVSREAMSRGEG